MLKHLLLLILASFSLQAADGWLGTWKIDPSRSHFENTDVIKEGVLVITEEGGNHVLNFTLTMTDGKIIHEGIKQPNKGGKLIPIGDTHVGNGVLEVPNDHEWIYKYYSKDGKLQATRYVTLSKDGKTQEADLQAMHDGKKIVEHEVAVKQ